MNTESTHSHMLHCGTAVCAHGAGRMLLCAVMTALHLCIGSTNAHAQQFFNLTADEVRVDSVLPVFTHTFSLPDNYADSVYTVSIDYPEFIDMSAIDVRRCLSVRGDTMPSMPVIDSFVGVSRRKASLYTQFVPIVVRNGKWQKLVSFKLTLHAEGAPMRARRATSASKRYADHSVLATGQWAKISVPATGFYQLTEALVRQAGFSSLSKVKVYGYGGALQPERITGDYLEQTDDLSEVPTCEFGGRRVFHATGPVGWSSATATERTRNPYSDVGCYFLTENDAEPLTVDSAALVGANYPHPNDYHSLHEIDDFAWYHSGRNLYESTLLASNAANIYHLDAYSTSGTLTIAITFDKPFEVSVTVNDSVVGHMSHTNKISKYAIAGARVFTFAIDGILKDDNTIVLRQISGGDTRLDYMSIASKEPAPLPNLRASSLPAPNFVYRITNQDHHADPAADMVIIIPTTQKTRTQAERLKQLHEQVDSMRVNIVPADELFNEFSSGTPDANAYRRYMKMLYDRAETEADMPRYLLLFGDGAWDNRMVLDEWRMCSPDDFLLCYQSENSYSNTDSYVTDDFYCMLDDGEGSSLTRSDKADIGVGRLTARTEAEAKIMVDKIVSYHNNEHGGNWQNTICFMGDDGNNNAHMRDVEAASQVALAIDPAYNFKRIYWDSYPLTSSSTGNRYLDVERMIKQQMKDGALVMDYCGHGAAYCLSHEKVAQIADFSTHTSLRLPLWVTASCDIMPYDTQEENIGEAAMLNPQGGAVAFFGTTRTVFITDNKNMNCAFIKHVLGSENGRKNTLGDAVRLSKNEVRSMNDEDSSPINKMHYTLLGDPAMALARPTGRVIVDSLNGQAAKTMTTLNAGQPVVVKGHIEGEPGFNGVVTLTVKDVEQLIVCKLNDISEDGAQEAFEYYDRPNTLYMGSDSVRQGQFTINFVLPRDISYSEESGLMTLYALSNDKKLTAHGTTSNFVVNSGTEMTNDGIGPSIYCYLNSSSFTNGDNVNTTPYFYAELTDKDGINTSGNGIGHDLELTIDGDLSMTYILNDVFQYNFGDYRSGYVGYSLPELSEGPHKLQFRAWDIFNNSSVAELSFNVVRSLEPQCFSVGCTKNPAVTNTTFIVNHDRTGSTIDVEVEVFDASGRQVWHHAEQGVATDNTYTVNWNLTVNGGSRLQTGVYLYRVLVSSDGSKKASKARKLIVISH